MFTIKEAKTAREKEAANRLRYEVYTHDQGYHIQDEQVVQDEHADREAKIIIALNETDEIVGTMHVFLGDQTTFTTHQRDLYDLTMFEPVITPEHFVIFESFAFRADYRNTFGANQLFMYSTQLALQHDAELIFLVAPPYLLELYQTLGSRSYTFAYDHNWTGIVIPQVYVISDLDYLRKIRSKVLRFETDYTVNPAVAKRVRPLLKEPYEIAHDTLSQRIEKWIQLYSLNTIAGHVGISIFEGLSETDLQIVLRRSIIIFCRQGDRITVQGTQEKTVYVVLSGTAVQTNDNHSMSFIAGDVIGEIGFLTTGIRATTIVTTSPQLDLLTISDLTLRKLVNRHPHIASQIMYNLARILGHKLAKQFQP
ncbi:MAG: cyclic nucleotide-binding domain-containing protein [Chloroflexota bacterium]